jgi:hypothetical protein
MKHHLLSMTGIVTLPVLLSQCVCGSPPPPDFTPFGDGLTAIGICLVCYAVVQVLGDLAGGGKS